MPIKRVSRDVSFDMWITEGTQSSKALRRRLEADTCIKALPG